MGRLSDFFRRKNPLRIRVYILIEFLFDAVLLIYIVPLLHSLLARIMKLRGQSYITDKNVLSFALYPPTILLFIGVILFFSVYTLWKITSMLQYGFTFSGRKSPGYSHLFSASLFISIMKIIKGNLLLPFYSLMIYLFTIFPLIIVFVPFADPPLYLSPSVTLFLRTAAILISILLSFFAFRGLFTLHYCIDENMSLQQSRIHSKELLSGRRIRALSHILRYNIILGLLYYLLYQLSFILLALFVYLFTDKNIAVSTFLSYYPRIRLFLITAMTVVACAANIRLISYLYDKYRKEIDSRYALLRPSIGQTILPVLPRSKYHRMITLTLSLLAIAGLINFYHAVRNNALFLQEALSGMKIVSHRGSSLEAPENTLAALEYAISAHSDYAEIDVQATKDGVLVLLHDYSLKRTTGVNRYIWEITYEELKELDAGSWFGEEFAGTPIPTLEEALVLCKERIKLNIEVKIHGRERDLEEQLVALIDQYDFKYQCVISSWNYSSLVRIKELDRDLRAGYILSSAYGQFYTSEIIDFLSLRSSFVDKNVVDQAHKAGKEVHAWTVNSRREMERMKSLGVDSIITDNPYLAQEVLWQTEENQNFVQLLNRMLKNNSLYQILR